MSSAAQSSSYGLPWVFRRLDHYLFAPTSPTNLGVCRILFFGWLLHLYWDIDSAPWPTLVDPFWLPVWPFDSFPLPIASSATLGVLDVVWKLCLVLACVGFCTRPATIGSFVLGFYLLGLPQNFGKISHQPGLLVIITAILACSRCGDAFSIDRAYRTWRLTGALRQSGASPQSGEYRWPIRLVWLVVAVAFFAAGVAKLQGSGWIASDGLKYLFASRYYQQEEDLTGIGLWIAQQRAICILLGTATVVVEAAAPLALVFASLRLPILGSLFLMQLGNSQLLGIHTAFPWAAAYAFWVPWDALFRRIRPPP